MAWNQTREWICTGIAILCSVLCNTRTVRCWNLGNTKLNKHRAVLLLMWLIQFSFSININMRHSRRLQPGSVFIARCTWSLCTIESMLFSLYVSLSLTHSFGYGNLSPTLSEYYTNGLVFQIRFVFTFGSFKRHTQHLINLCVSCKITDIPLSIVPHQLHKFTHMKLTSETIKAVSYQFNWFGVGLIHVVKTWYEWMLLHREKVDFSMRVYLIISSTIENKLPTFRHFHSFIDPFNVSPQAFSPNSAHNESWQTERNRIKQKLCSTFFLARERENYAKFIQFTILNESVCWTNVG